MLTSVTLVAVLVTFAAAMAAAVAIRPSITNSTGGRIFAFAALLVVPVLAGTAGLSEHVEKSKQTEFCLSCHVMEQYGKSLDVDDRSHIPAVHYQNHLVPADRACFTCHTTYTLFGDYKAKLKGLRHVYVQYVGTIPTHIKLYEAYSNRECLHCHLGARSFEEGAMHNVDPATLPAVKANKLSCISAGCHEAAHDVANLSKQTFWPEVTK
ncbi:MAG: NapC/NirT family cytochrome c [Acidobacteriota bacterium]